MSATSLPHQPENHRRRVTLNLAAEYARQLSYHLRDAGYAMVDPQRAARELHDQPPSRSKSCMKVKLKLDSQLQRLPQPARA